VFTVVTSAYHGTTVATGIVTPRDRGPTLSEDAYMLWTIAMVLLILWILGFFVVHVGGGLIHLLLVIAVIVIIYRLITGRPVA
jgi:hypothetical protein